MPSTDPLAFPTQRADPSSSQSFIRTTPEGEELLLTCPSGFSFSTDELKCVRSDTRKVSSKKLSLPECPAAFRGTLPIEKDCRTFLNCWDGIGYETLCAAHLVYNEGIGTCDYPETAGCCEYWENDSSLIVQST